MSGAITGTLRKGSTSIGQTKIVLPLTCVVYCDAPITVARMPSAGFSSFLPQFWMRARISPAEHGARDRRSSSSRGHRHIRTRRRKSSLPRSRARWVSGSRRNSDEAPTFGEPPFIASNSRSVMRAASARASSRLQHRAEFELEPELGAELPARFLERVMRPALVGHHKTCADIDRGQVDHLAVGADRDLRRAAADIDVHHRRLVADRARRPRPSHRPPSRFRDCRRR